MKGNIRFAWLLIATACLGACGGKETEPLTPARSTEVAPDDLSYPDPNMFVQGVPIEPLVPTVRGTPTNYMVTPDLPAGLRLLPDGRITGTPTEPRGPGTYLVSAGNSAGVSSFGVRITIVGRFTVGGTASGLSGGALELTNNGRDTLTVNEDGQFTFSEPLAAGAPYAVTVSAQPAGQTCTVTRGSGLLANRDVGDILVTCSASASGKIFAYVDSKMPLACVERAVLDGFTYAFEVEAAALDEIVRVRLDGCDPELVTVDATRAWVYVRNPAGASFSVYVGDPLRP